MAIAASVKHNEFQYGTRTDLDRFEMIEGAKKLKEMGYRILVVNLPMTGNWVHRPFFESCLGMCAGSAYQYFDSQKVRMLVNICSDFPIDHNRNKSARVAIEQFGADYIMNLDTDQTFKPSTIVEMWERIHKPAPDGSEIEALAGMYFMKNPPFRPVLGPFTGWEAGMDHDYLDKQGFVCHGECGDEEHSKGAHQLVRWCGPHYWPEDKLFRADVIGVGCVMTKASMWAKLEYPFFKYAPDPMKGPKNGDANEISEDMFWCANMHKAGVKVWIDPSIQCGHLGVMEANRDMNRGALESAKAYFASLPADNKSRLSFEQGIVDVR